MASLMFEGQTCIDYSLVDGRVTCFELHGHVLYDETKIIYSEEDWRRKLYDFIKSCGLDEDDGFGLHAFIPELLKEFE
jgi:hypothetical protein